MVSGRTTISRAKVGGSRVYSIRRGRSAYERLGTLVSKEPHYRADGKRTGWMVRFELDGDTTYYGFAGGSTVVRWREVRA